MSNSMLSATRVSDALRESGSDKVTDHSYGPLYDSLLGSQANSIRSLLEIGILNGSSLQAWQNAFPHAMIYGLDINAPATALTSPQCRIAQCDATEPQSLLPTLYQLGILPLSLDVIIDDASHTYRDQIATLMLLWDYLRPGGHFFIEDVQPRTPLAPFIRLGGIVHDLRWVQRRHDDVVIVFVKPG